MATQITADLPTLDFPREVDYPTQEDWAAFSAAAEENFGILGGDWSTQMQLWKTQANAMSTELNNNADLAQAVANYQGDWVSQGYTLGQTVSIGEVYYICKLTHSTGQNPTDVSSLYWNLALGNWSLKVNTDMSGYTSKATPVDADLIPLSDSASSFGIKKLTWANIKTTLKTYFDTLYSKLTPTIASGTATSNTTTNRITMTGIGANGNEVGDVILMSGWANNNGDFTIEVIEDANNIIVNQAHANKSLTYPNGNRTKTLATETANVTVKLLAKHYNAAEGLGQDWVNMTASRAINTLYPNLTNRTIGISYVLYSTSAGLGYSIEINGFALQGVTEQANRNDSYVSLTKNGTIKIVGGTIVNIFERR